MIKKTKKILDLKLISILSTVYAFFVIIYTSKNAFLILKYPNNVKTDLSTFFFSNFLDWIIVTCFMVFIVYITKMMMQKKTKLFFVIIIHLFFSFFLGIFTLGTTWLIENFSINKSMIESTFDGYFIWYLRLIDLHFLIYISSATIIYMYYYYNKTQENQILNSKLKEQLAQTKLKFLQTQMHPHFLFNTLNSIYSLMDIDVNKSKNMVVDLSEILRNVLDKKDQNLVELQEELFLLKKYINIKKTRFSDQLTIVVNVENGLENVLVPNMLLQPIFENSIKHGYDSNHITLEVYVSIYKKHDMLNIKIENTGKKLNEDLSKLMIKGTGLNNILERLQALYQKNHKLSVYNKNDKVVTKISIPIRMSISELIQDY